MEEHVYEPIDLTHPGKTQCSVCQEVWFKIGVLVPNSDVRVCSTRCVEKAYKKLGIEKPELMEV